MSDPFATDGPVQPESVADQRKEATPAATPAKTATAAAPATGPRVTLATRWPLGTVTVPPLEEGGETYTIGPDGTEVDAETAQRAHEAAAAAGHAHLLTEL